MLEKKQESTYFFIGKLSDHSAKYFISNLKITDNLFLEVMLDGFSIWGDTEKEFNIFFRDVKEIIDILVSAFVFGTQKPLSFMFEHWIESKKIISKENMIGWILNTHGSIQHYPRYSKYNTCWKKAVYLYQNINKLNNNHILALKDYRSALIDTSDDAFLFAYRSIEDICRASTGCDDVNNKAWEKMHNILDTSKITIDSLRSVAEKVRHGDKTNQIVVQAKNEREKLIKTAHEVIEKEFERKLPKFLK
jgi:hypothetical protein